MENQKNKLTKTYHISSKNQKRAKYSTTSKENADSTNSSRRSIVNEQIFHPLCDITNVNESFEKVVNYGLEPNMIIYLMTFYNMSAATGAIILGIWGALSNGLSIVGAFVSDSYLGRFRTVAIGSFSSLIGTIILWLTAIFPQLRSLPCSQFQHICDGTKTVQLAVLLSSFGFMSLGIGFIRPCSIIFGVDQLEKNENPENKRLIDSYFNWYYASTGISAILAVTIIVYIQDHYGWQV